MKKYTVFLPYVMFLFILFNLSLSGCNSIPAPSNLQVKPISFTQIDLTWRDNSNNEQGFVIFRSEDASNYMQIAKVNADIVTYSDTGLKINTTYYYRIRAYNSNGNSNYSNVVHIKTGVITWAKTFGGSNKDYVQIIQQTADGGYIVAGDSFSNDGDVTGNHDKWDYWIVKLDSSGTILWQKSLGGSNGDSVHSLLQTTDGGYIIAGYTTSNDGDVSGYHGFSDYWIVKLNSSGTIQWQKSLGGSSYDNIMSLQQTADGGYIIAGESSSNDGDVSDNHGNWDYWIVKLNASGIIQWQKSFGGSNGDSVQKIQQTTEGDYIIAGNSYSNDGDVIGNHGDRDYWIVKINSSGSILWQKSLGGSGDDYLQNIQQTTDNGYIIAGISNSNDGDVNGNHGVWDYWIVKLDSSGNIQWQKSLGGSSYEVVQNIQQTIDGGYIIDGNSYSYDGNVSGNHGGLDYWIVKLNASGTIQWRKSLGGSSDENVRSLQQTSDGGYIVAGDSYSNNGNVSDNHGSCDYWIVKLNASGIIQWQKSLGGSSDENVRSLQQTSDGGYIIAGNSYSNDGNVSDNHGSCDYWIVKLNENGDIY